LGLDENFIRIVFQLFLLSLEFKVERHMLCASKLSHVVITFSTAP